MTVLILGFPLEPIPLIMMLIPILHPVVEQLGIEAIHFVMVFTVNIQLAFLTPPVGANLFVATAISESMVMKVSRVLVPPCSRPSWSLFFGRILPSGSPGC